VDPALALSAAAQVPEEASSGQEPPSAARIRREAAEIEGRRVGAGARMERSMAGSATGEAHRAEVRDASEGEDDGDGGPVPREVAAVVGTAVHRMLETLDLESGLEEQVDDRRAELEAEVERGVDPPSRGLAAGHLENLLGRLTRGALLARLEELAPRVVARELALLLPPPGGEGPVGFLAGRVDLVYSDPRTGELVVADYKTDAVEEGAELEERVRLYAPQVELYARGLQEALGLDRAPRRELWFLAADRVVEITAGC
jgi:ATP-dependent exoDNAse (exonuclease V) beta subunit